MKRVTAIIALWIAAGSLPACGGSEHATESTAQAPIAVTVFLVTAVETTERLEAAPAFTQALVQFLTGSLPE